MFGLSGIDLFVILIYFIIVIIIGLYSVKHVHNQEDYFLGGRRFGKIVQTFAAFGQATSADSAVGTTTTTFNNGISGIWSGLLTLWATPIYWLTSPWYRRLRVLTTGDFFEERYGSRKMASFFAIIATLLLMSLIALGMKSVSVTIMAITTKSVEELTPAEQQQRADYLEWQQLEQTAARKNISPELQQKLENFRLQQPRGTFSHINETVLVWSICLIVFAYAIAGGLEAAMYTDTLQGVFIILLSLMMIPFGLAQINETYGSQGVIGAFRTMHQQLPESCFQIFGSVAAADFTWYYIIAISLLMAVNVAVQANQMNAIGSARDEMTARVGFTTGNFIKRFCVVLWGFFGLIALVLFADKVDNSDYLWGYATNALFGPLGIGLVGLMVACLMAALMSTADTLLITSSGVLTHNLYLYLVPNRTEKHYVTVGRVMGALILVGSALLATWFDTILQMLKFVWEFNAVLAAAFWCGMKWRRANRIGAWSSMFFALTVFSLVPILLPAFFPSLTTDSHMLKSSKSITITQTYTAKEKDVLQRQKQIAQWELLDSERKSQQPRPEPLKLNEKFTISTDTPSKPIFWSKGVKYEAGNKYGQGLLYIDMVIIDKFVDLSQYSYPVSETIRTLLRVILPFLILIIVSLLTKADDPDRLDRFFVKMRTPVIPDPKLDQEELQKSYDDPSRYREKLLFPNSGLELLRWNKVDSIGFAISVSVVFVVIALLYFLVSLGS